MITSRLVGAATVLMVVVVAAGCVRAADVQAAASPVYDATGTEVLAGIIDQVYGTSEQRQAGHARQFYAWQAALGGCMTGKGVDFDVPAYTPPQPTEVGPGDLLAFSPRRVDFGIARGTIALAKTGSQDNPALLKATGEQREQWIAVQSACEPATKASEELAQADGMTSVDAKLIDELAKIQDELAPGLPAAYVTCMNDAGLPVGEGLVSEAYVMADQKFPVVSYETVSDPRTLKGWDEAVAFERQVAASDWQCRGDEATRVVDAGGDVLGVWAERHRAELNTVAAAWARMPALRDAAHEAAVEVTGKH